MSNNQSKQEKCCEDCKTREGTTSLFMGHLTCPCHSKKVCCEDCRKDGIEFEPGEISPLGEPICTNHTCPCHSKKEENRKPFKQACEKCYLGDSSVDLCPCHYAKEMCKCHNPQEKGECPPHEPTGRWSVRNGKSYADCKKCGEYETTLMEKDTFPPTDKWEGCKLVGTTKYHVPTDNGWSERFDNKYPHGGLEYKSRLVQTEVKEFLSKEIEAARLSERERMKDKVDMSFDSFLLNDWSGEAEVYEEIGRLKKEVLSIFTHKQ